MPTTPSSLSCMFWPAIPVHKLIMSCSMVSTLMKSPLFLAKMNLRVTTYGFISKIRISCGSTSRSGEDRGLSGSSDRFGLHDYLLYHDAEHFFGETRNSFIYVIIEVDMITTHSHEELKFLKKIVPLENSLSAILYSACKPS